MTELTRRKARSQCLLQPCPGNRDVVLQKQLALATWIAEYGRSGASSSSDSPHDWHTVALGIICRRCGVYSFDVPRSDSSLRWRDCTRATSEPWKHILEDLRSLVYCLQHVEDMMYGRAPGSEAISRDEQLATPSELDLASQPQSSSRLGREDLCQGKRTL